MPKTLYATIAVELPDDQFEAAAMLVAFKPAWETFQANLPKGCGKYTPKLETLETRARATNGTGARRGRKPRQPAPEAGAPQL